MRIPILTFGAFASVLTINSVMADTTVTSKTYVDTTRQATIPAAGTNRNTPGSAVVTYTGTAGQIGERFICDADAEDNGYCNDDNLVTLDLLDSQISGLNDQMDNFDNYVSEQITNLPETTVTYKTCYQEVNGECILWNLTDKYVYGKCRNDSDCDWMDAQCDSGLSGFCRTGKCVCGAR